MAWSNSQNAGRHSDLDGPDRTVELIDNRQNLKTVNPDSHWLFRGRRAGQPVHVSTLLGHLRTDLGQPSQAAKSATLRRLVLQARAAVVADTLGFSAHHI
ncbi:hypothetical protein IU450_35210 [Nocardia abscessus]|uniref:hypothetical protein n=1 Tax=Nocardia abscessus TaxID=120957 RepID=UPI0018936D16|nr:hypothetical protein [Nocardia abscessus]MBF6341104.1 hypothetical protein [Nocardia abscessus]